MTFQVDRQITRSNTGFTQGLEFYKGKLFESTGLLAGGTRLDTITPAGAVKTLDNFGQQFFGEGLTILNDQIYQLSWTEHRVAVYDMKGKLLRRMTNPREGWGLTHDGKNLITSNGSTKLFFVSPKDFSLVRTLPVFSGPDPQAELNELEYVDGKIYANVFLTDLIVRIDANSGCVDATADLSDLKSRMSGDEIRHIDSDLNYVLNGIAYDPSQHLFYITGKSWQSIFTGHFVIK